MKEGLFTAIVMDKRVPEIRLRISKQDHDWYGNFVGLNLKKSSPQVAVFDAWTEEDFKIMQRFPKGSAEYHSAASRGIDFEVFSSAVDDIEIIGFVNPKPAKRAKGQRKPIISKKLEWAYPPCRYELDTLKDWNLVEWNIIRSEAVLALFKSL
ncbi:hypothetical protein BWI96_18885 [Siphonobacter sp. SORGH_AS_0500]|uniref:hypothetical protein n=1 Tax=Siphonobacter sp. SORGH_AS_0500 TaxID=1864824 RepID=UPI000CC084B1|nr:hypothetical protein [Siphonobacter sp. SORGH_AS_0500]PKK35120.1 hypothetical protein BWI96_18885 [Siphonobacter sp. SORGH_AS_0500]